MHIDTQTALSVVFDQSFVPFAIDSKIVETALSPLRRGWVLRGGLQIVLRVSKSIGFADPYCRRLNAVPRDLEELVVDAIVGWPLGIDRVACCGISCWGICR